MIRRLASPPAGWNGRFPVAPPGALSVNQVEQNGTKLAAYWNDDDNQAMTDAQWATYVTSASYARPAEETNEADALSKLDQALDPMRVHVARGTFTAQQRDAALLLVLRVCIGLVKVALRRHDRTD